MRILTDWKEAGKSKLVHVRCHQVQGFCRRFLCLKLAIALSPHIFGWARCVGGCYGADSGGVFRRHRRRKTLGIRSTNCGRGEQGAH